MFPFQRKMLRLLKPGFGRIILVFFLVWEHPISAQQPVWKSYGKLDQLSDPNVMIMNRHPDGTVYLGTQNGIIALNGEYTQQFTCSFDRGNRINPFIHCIGFKGNYIYSGTRNSLWMINRKNGEIKTFLHPFMNQTGVTSLAFSPDSSRIYACTIEGVLIYTCLNDSLALTGKIPLFNAVKANFYQSDLYIFLGKKELLRIKNSRKESVYKDESLWDLQWIPEKKYWVAVTRKGIQLVYPDGRKSAYLNLHADWQNLTVDRTLMPGLNHTVFVRFTNGVLQLDPEKPALSIFHQSEENNPYTISSNTSDFVYTDPQQNTWYAASAIGLSYLEKDAADIFFLSNTSMNIKHFWSIYQDQKSGLYFLGTDKGILAGSLLNNRFHLKKRIEDPAKPTFIITSIIPYDAQHLLVTSFGYGCFLLNRVTLELNPFSRINSHLDSQNLFGAYRLDSQSFLIYSQAGSMLFNAVNLSLEPLTCDGKKIFDGNFNLCALKDSKNRLWVGSGGGILRCDQNFHKTGLYSNEPGNQKSLSSNVVLNFLETSGGEIYIATMGGGLCRFHEKDQTFSAVRLSRNPVNIYGIMQADDDHLILTTSHGLCLYNLKTEESTQLNKDNLLPFNDFNQTSFYLDSKYLLAGGEKGLLIIRRDKIREVFSEYETLALRQKGQIVNHVVLEPENRSLELYCSLLDDLPHRKISVSYHLDGFEQQLHTLSESNNQIQYNYLPPGKYTLSIHVADSNNYYRIPSGSITITVKPFFYESLWFRLLSILVLTGILILIVRYFSLARLRWKLKKLENEQRISNERLRISRELHDNVGSQLTYLISGLEASEMMLKNNKINRLEENINNLQDSARESIQQLRQAIWALNREEISCSGLADQFHLWLKKMLEPHPDLELRFHTMIENDPLLDPLKGLNIYRILQEAVNNVVKHANADLLELSIRADHQQLVVVIQDNGKGFDPGISGGNGMQGMKHRANETGGELSVISSPGKGCLVRLTIHWG